MNPTPDRVGFAKAQALLSKLPDSYFSTLKAARLEEQVDDGVTCTFEVPGYGKRTASAASAVEAIRLALIELASLLTSALQRDSMQAMNTKASLTGSAGVPADATVERFRSKDRKITVGVTMPIILKQHLSTLADSQGTTFADMSRNFTVFGFEDFRDKSFFVSAQSLFAQLTSELHKWQKSDSEQVMLRLEPSQAVRIRATAKEYKKSASEFSALCMAHGLTLQEQLVSLENQIANYKGAAIRPLLSKLGLEPHAAPLLSGILRGSVQAPKLILKRLATFFDASETILTDFFVRSFTNKSVPAFKAENGKPVVRKTITSWEEAVRSMKLPSDETKNLLDLDA